MDEYISKNNAISAVCFGCNQQFSNEPCEPSDCTIRQSIMALPTADVAPKSEVVRKICCEIEEEIVAALKSNYKVKAERLATPDIYLADEFISICEGKIAALRGIKVFVEELKKKYTEEK